MKVIGVDPGTGVRGAGERATATGGTGIVALDGDRIVWYGTMLREPGETVRSFAGRVIDRLTEIAVTGHGEWMVAVEMPRGPGRFVDLPGTVTLAYLIAEATDARQLKPNGYGKRPFREYPRELQGHRPDPTRRRNQPAPGGVKTRDHERAAFDIARAAQSVTPVT